MLLLQRRVGDAQDERGGRVQRADQREKGGLVALTGDGRKGIAAAGKLVAVVKNDRIAVAVRVVVKREPALPLARIQGVINILSVIICDTDSDVLIGLEAFPHAI